MIQKINNKWVLVITTKSELEAIQLYKIIKGITNEGE